MILDDFIIHSRESYKPHFKPEMKMGCRFFSNQSVKDRFVSIYFGYLSNKNAEDIPNEFIQDNIKSVFDDLCYADWHFLNK